ncbi:MAG: C_GCAxxG_C_C family protein [Opitutae bacterium]|nr:C_GCAxxG_C_C family protein [Opitutae bacterium]
MSTTADNAETLFLQGYNCAQAVAHACTRDGGVAPEFVVKLATGFGAGMGRKQEVCGAVTGGILALSLRQGRALGDDKARTGETYAAVRELMNGFAAQHGSCRCCELLDGCDLQTEAGQREFQEKGYLRGRCLGYVRTAAELVG